MNIRRKRFRQRLHNLKNYIQHLRFLPAHKHRAIKIRTPPPELLMPLLPKPNRQFGVSFLRNELRCHLMERHCGA
jgi:hypothetical protein